MGFVDHVGITVPDLERSIDHEASASRDPDDVPAALVQT